MASLLVFYSDSAAVMSILSDICIVNVQGAVLLPITISKKKKCFLLFFVQVSNAEVISTSKNEVIR